MERIILNPVNNIEFEQIQIVSYENGLGDARSKADKQLKAVIIKKIFGTTSTTEIEKMDAAQLSWCRSLLEELFASLSAANPEDPIAFVNELNTKAVA